MSLSLFRLGAIASAIRLPASGASVGWNASDFSPTTASFTLASSNTQASSSTLSGRRTIRSLLPIYTGKRYFEIKINTITATNSSMHVGIIGPNALPSSGDWLDMTDQVNARGNGQVFKNGSAFVGSLSNIFTSGSVVGFAVDMGTKNVSIYLNNVFQLTTSFTPNVMYPMAAFEEGPSSVTLQALSTNQTYTPPTGYTAAGDSLGAHSYWRLMNITVPGGGFLEISELQLLEGTVVVSSGQTHSTSNTPSLGVVGDLFDGSTATRPFWSEAVAEASGFYIQVQFSTPRAITAVKQAGFDTSTRYMDGFTLQYSDDGSSWTTLGTKSGLTYPGNNTLSAAYTFP